MGTGFMAVIGWCKTEHHAEAVWPCSGSVPGGNKDRGPLILLIFFNLKCPSWFASITTNPRTTRKTPCLIWMDWGATGPDTEVARWFERFVTGKDV